MTTATVVGALDHAAASPQRDDAGQPEMTAQSGWATTARSRQYADALNQIWGEWAGGHTAGEGAADATAGSNGDSPRPGPVTSRRPKPVIRVGWTWRPSPPRLPGWWMCRCVGRCRG